MATKRTLTDATPANTVYSFKRLKNINLAKVTRLIVVDTRQPNRIGKLQECLDNPHLDLHLYDHHPATAGDMAGDLEVIEMVGATSTIFVRLFQERQVKLTSHESTLLALAAAAPGDR